MMLLYLVHRAGGAVLFGMLGLGLIRLRQLYGRESRMDPALYG